MRWVHMTHLKTAKNLQLNISEKIWDEHLQSKHRNLDVKTQKTQKTISKGGIILGQVADSLIKIKHSKDMTAGDMKNAVMPLIQMCTDRLTFCTW